MNQPNLKVVAGNKKTLPKHQDNYTNYSYRILSPEGTVFIFIMEDDNGIPSGIQVFVGKSGSAIRAWALAFAELVTTGLMNGGMSIYDVMHICSSQSTDKNRLIEGGVFVRSGIEAIYIALHRYVSDKFQTLNEQFGLSGEDDPIGMAHMIEENDD